MEADEYESTKSETLKQLEEFHASLSKLMARDAFRAHGCTACLPGDARAGWGHDAGGQSGQRAAGHRRGHLQGVQDTRGTGRASARRQSQLTAAAAQVIKLFALKQPAQLRQRLEQLQARARRSCNASRAPLLTLPPPTQRDKKLGKITKADATQQAMEILTALQKLGDEVRGSLAHLCMMHAA